MIKLWSFAPKARENFCLPLWSNYDHPPLWSFILSEFTWNKMIKLWSNIPLFRSDVHNNWTEKVENSRKNSQKLWNLLVPTVGIPFMVLILVVAEYYGATIVNCNINGPWAGIYYAMCKSRLAHCKSLAMHFRFFRSFCLKKSFVLSKWSNYDHSNFWKTLPTIMIKLWSPTIMIIWSRQRLGWTKSAIMIDHFSGGPLYCAQRLLLPERTFWGDVCVCLWQIFVILPKGIWALHRVQFGSVLWPEKRSHYFLGPKSSLN